MSGSRLVGKSLCGSLFPIRSDLDGCICRDLSEPTFCNYVSTLWTSRGKVDRQGWGPEDSVSLEVWDYNVLFKGTSGRLFAEDAMDSGGARRECSPRRRDSFYFEVLVLMKRVRSLWRHCGILQTSWIGWGRISAC